MYCMYYVDVHGKTNNNNTKDSYIMLKLLLSMCAGLHFTNRVVNLWNYLPSHVVCAPTVNSFKSRLDNYWNSIKYGQTQRSMA